jgi:hypothetical protein
MKFVKTTLLFICSLLLTLVLAEFVVRWALDDITSTANMQTWFGKRWKTDHVDFNSLHFREKELVAEKQDGVNRILIIGDSFAFGQGIPIEDRFGNIIERELDTSIKQFEVLNLSKPGANTAEELATLKEVGLPLNPDFILVQWLPNDYQTAAQTWGTSERPRLYSIAGLQKTLSRKSALYFLLENQWNNLKPMAGENYTAYDDNLLAPFQNPSEEEYQLTVRPMLDLLTTLNASGIDYAIALHPMLMPEMGQSYRLQPLHDATQTLCRTAEARCFDLLPAFLTLGPDYNYGSLWVNRFDPHPGSQAHQIAADAILQEIGAELSD